MIEQLKKQREKEFTILHETEHFILSCRTEYLKDKPVYSMLKQKHNGILLGGKSYYIDLKNNDRKTHFGINRIFGIDKVKKIMDNKKPLNVIDLTHKGYYCIYCKKFYEKCIMDNDKTYIVDNNKFCLVNETYCGCRGWD